MGKAWKIEKRVMRAEIRNAIHSAAKSSARILQYEGNQTVHWGMKGGVDAIWQAVLEKHPEFAGYEKRDGLIAFARSEHRVPSGFSLPMPARERQPCTDADYRASPAFLRSYEWRRLRVEILEKYGAVCMACGARPPTKIHVDHIKPRKKYPELALEPTNLQVLCEECNHGKGNWSEKDWRSTHQGEVRDEQERKAQLH